MKHDLWKKLMHNLSKHCLFPISNSNIKTLESWIGPWTKKNNKEAAVWDRVSYFVKKILRSSGHHWFKWLSIKNWRVCYVIYLVAGLVVNVILGLRGPPIYLLNCYIKCQEKANQVLYLLFKMLSRAKRSCFGMGFSYTRISILRIIPDLPYFLFFSKQFKFQTISKLTNYRLSKYLGSQKPTSKMFWMASFYILAIPQKNIKIWTSQQPSLTEFMLKMVFLTLWKKVLEKFQSTLEIGSYRIALRIF